MGVGCGLLVRATDLAKDEEDAIFSYNKRDISYHSVVVASLHTHQPDSWALLEIVLKNHRNQAQLV